MDRFQRLFLQLWSSLNSSYWFIPAIMCSLGVGSSFLFVALDQHIGSEMRVTFGFLYSSQPSGARALLSMIAGSMITVAGVTFSMTLLSVSHASSQIGPRILSGFMDDRGNQITLGTFIATFSYCLLVLRTIQDKFEQTDQFDKIGIFVPHLSIAFAVFLAFCSIAVLIYFINHVPKSISMTLAINRIGDRLVKNIHSMYPSEIGQGVDTDEHKEQDPIPNRYRNHQQVVEAEGKGYITMVLNDRLMEIASESDLIVEVLKKPGDFVLKKSDLVTVYGREALNQATIEQLRAVFIWGSERTLDQDARFGAKLLVEVAARALSPGVNDPFSATECVDQLVAGLLELANREQISRARKDDQGDLRILVESANFCSLFNFVFDQLRRYVCGDTIVTKHVLESMGFLKAKLKKARHKLTVDSQAESLLEAFCKKSQDPRDTKQVHELATLVWGT